LVVDHRLQEQDLVRTEKVHLQNEHDRRTADHREKFFELKDRALKHKLEEEERHMREGITANEGRERSGHSQGTIREQFKDKDQLVKRKLEEKERHMREGITANEAWEHSGSIQGTFGEQ
jgi:hypothetical protein